MNDNDQLDCNESSLILRSNAPKLKTLASSRFALIVWQNEIIDHSLNRSIPSSNQIVEKFNTENVSSIPPCIRDLISKRIWRIRNELRYWICDPCDGLNRRTFIKNCDTWTKYFDELVWNVDCTIDYLKTSQNLLLSDRVSDEEKFIVACSYCMEDYIGDLWQRVQTAVDSDSLSESTDPWLLHYWIDRLKNQTLCKPISDTFDEEDLMLNMPLNRWATEYFWPCLSPNGQMRSVFSIISHRRNLNYLLPKMSEFALQLVVADRGPDVVEFLIKNVKCRPLAIPFWNHVTNIFQQRQFFELVKWMLVSEVGGLYCDFLKKAEVSLCQQIWASAPDQLKNYVLNYSTSNDLAFLRTRVCRSREQPYRGVRLLSMVLSEASSEQRSEIWRRNWLEFSTHAKYSDMNELLELCLENVNQRNEFKRQFASRFDDIQDYCVSLLRTLELGKLDEFLKVFSVDHDAKIVLKQRLVRYYFLETHSGCSNAYFRHIDEFMALIDESFSNPEVGARFKRDMMMSRVYLDRLLELLYVGDFDTIRTLVSACLSSEQDVVQWQEEFKHYCHYCLNSGSFREFDASQWQDFMMWCLGSEEKVQEFKKSLDADAIFEVFLEKCESRRHARELHKIFDSFLKWKFVSENELVAFKETITRTNPNGDEIHALMFG